MRSVKLEFGTVKCTVPKTPKVAFADHALAQEWALSNIPDAVMPGDVLITVIKQVSDVRWIEAGHDADTGEVVSGRYGVFDKASGQEIPGVEAFLEYLLYPVVPKKFEIV